MTKKPIKKVQKLIQALKNLQVTYDFTELFMYLFTI